MSEEKNIGIKFKKENMGHIDEFGDVKVIDLAKEGMLLPPKPGVCQECAVDHPPHYPHNAQSLYYQYKFYREHERWPTWKDAIERCDKGMKRFWTEELEKRGVKID